MAVVLAPSLLHMKLHSDRFVRQKDEDKIWYHCSFGIRTGFDFQTILHMQSLGFAESGSALTVADARAGTGSGAS